MANDPEILVHVGAPSAVSDDARYRALVESSLAFEPVSRRSIFDIHDNNEGIGNEIRVDDPWTSSSNELSSASSRGEETMSFHSGDELRSLVTPETLQKSEYIQAHQPSESTFQSAGLPPSHASTEEDSELSFRPLIPLDDLSNNRGQPSSSSRAVSANASDGQIGATSLASVENHETHVESSTWKTPLEVIPDSQGNEETAEKTMLDYSVQVSRSFVPDTARRSRRSVIGKENRSEDSGLSDVTRIPSSIPSPSPAESSSAYRPEEEADNGVLLFSNETTTHFQTAQPEPSGSAGIPQKRKTVLHDSSQESNTAKSGPHQSLSSNDSRLRKRPTLPRASEEISLDILPIEIRTPDPPVSNDKFRTHITSTLQSLAQRMKQSSRFKPTRQIRELHPLERGYWFVPCITIKPDRDANTTVSTTSPNIEGDVNTSPSQIWTQSFFSQFWCFLRDFLTEGRAGWGIWCLLEPCTSSSYTESSSSTSPSRSSDQSSIKVNLKLYTWGEVAPHMYLLLFLATERRIRKMEAVEWRDARDEGVIIM